MTLLSRLQEAVFSSLDDEMPSGRKGKKPVPVKNGAREARRQAPLALSPVKSAPGAIESNRVDPGRNGDDYSGRKWVASTRTSKSEKKSQAAPKEVTAKSGREEKVAVGALSPTGEALGSPTHVPSRFRDAIPGESSRDALIGALSRTGSDLLLRNEVALSDGGSRTGSNTRSVPLRTGTFISPKKEAAEIFQLRQMNARLMRLNEQMLAKSKEYDRLVSQGAIEAGPTGGSPVKELLERRVSRVRGVHIDGVMYSRGSSFTHALTPRSMV